MLDILKSLSTAEIMSVKVSLDNLIDSSCLFRPSSIALLWVILFSMDWLLDYWTTVLYHRQVRKFCILESGYNVKEITADELKNPFLLFLRYLSELLISTVAIWLLLYVCRLFSSWRFYELFCGYFILLEACIHFRHIRTVALFSLVKPESGFYGSIAVPKWMILHLAFVEYGIFGIGYLLVFFFDSSNYFVLGGVLACLFALLFNISISEKERRTFLAKNPEIERIKT